MEMLRIGVFKFGKFFVQQDIFFSKVVEDKGDFGFVVGVVEDGVVELVYGGDVSVISDEGNVVVFVFGLGVFGQRVFDVEVLVGGYVV